MNFDVSIQFFFIVLGFILGNWEPIINNGGGERMILSRGHPDLAKPYGGRGVDVQNWPEPEGRST